MAADIPSHQRVLIANISRGQVGIPLVGGVLGALSGGQACRAVFVESGPYLDAGRNRAIEHAYLETDDDAANGLAWDWLLFIDSDMQFQPEDITTLLQHHPPTSELSVQVIPDAFPVVGGYYVNPYDDGLYPEEGNVGPVVYNWAKHDEPGLGVVESFRRMSTTSIETLPGLHGNQLLQVSMIGTGFLAIHHTLLTAMQAKYGDPTPWFDEPIVNGRLYGEDMGFALRCAEMGYPLLLNRACRVAHNKTMTLTPPIPTTGDTIPGV